MTATPRRTTSHGRPPRSVLSRRTLARIAADGGGDVENAATADPPKTADGKDLGEIDHLVINAKTGQISHAVIGVGGLAGIGSSKRVVQWSDLRIQPDPVNPWWPIASIDQSVVDRAPLWPARAEGRDPVPAASPPTTPPIPGTR